MTHYQVGETILAAHGIRRQLGDTLILSDVSFEIRNLTRPDATTGQVCALLGPSGIGKTQLFRVLAGLVEADSGTVLVGADAKPVRRGMMGVVAQHYPLFAHRTVLGNLTLAATRRASSSRDAEERVNEYLERFGLTDTAAKYPAQLSGGQRQRVAIAQQFLCSDHFVLMDEPFSGLDVLQIENVARLIREIASAHDLNTLIIVTHDIRAALDVADTIWLIGRDRNDDGSVIPGATIQATYDLAELGLAWREDGARDAEVNALESEIRQRFRTL